MCIGIRDALGEALGECTRDRDTIWGGNYGMYVRDRDEENRGGTMG